MASRGGATRVWAAGGVMTAYGLVGRTSVEAGRGRAPSSQKMFVRRLAQAGGEGPVSAVTSRAADEMPSAGSALPLFARY